LLDKIQFSINLAKKSFSLSRLTSLNKFIVLKMATIIRRIISTAKAPRPAAPYNQAIVVDRTVYLSGVLGIDKDSGKLVAGGAVPEAVKALENMQNILAAAGSKAENVIKCTVLLNDIADFAAVNSEYIKGLNSIRLIRSNCLT
jgi:2-iminobutanoate/2-iminopropanoate deaminase